MGQHPTDTLNLQPTEGRPLEPEYTYQTVAIRKLTARGKSAVISCPGSGKTRIILEALKELQIVTYKGTFPDGPVLILCSGPAIRTWCIQIPQWLLMHGNTYIVRGTKEQRTHLWDQAKSSGRGFYVTNFSVFLHDKNDILGDYWGAVIADEYQKAMRGRKTQTFDTFKRLVRHMKHVFLATGSMIRKNPASMWTLFHIMDPKLFRGYWKFVNTFCIVNETEWGKEIIGPKNLANLKKLTDRYLAYIPEEVVASQLPKGKRNSIHVEMTPYQAAVYKDLAQNMIAELESSITVAPTVLVKITRLRQLLCIPKILDESLGYGGGFGAICDTLDNDSHVVIFVPFRPACNYVKEGLLECGYKDVFIMRGGMTATEQHEAIEGFKETRGIIVCTIAYAESFDLETCKTSFFLGYDHALDVNEQAEGRTRRAISQHKFVTWNYICYDDTIDEDFLMTLNVDKLNVSRVLQRSPDLISALKGGTQ